VLLELARRFAEVEPACTVRFVRGEAVAKGQRSYRGVVMLDYLLHNAKIDGMSSAGLQS